MKKKLLIAVCVLCSFGLSFAANPTMNVLVFTKTMGFYHAAKPNAVKAFYEIAHENNWLLTVTEDSTYFTDANLKKYNVVVFLLTTGNNLLDANQRLAFQHFIERGGGFVGVHTSTDTEYKWPWYTQLVGAHFLGHPPVHDAKLIIEDKHNPATECFGTDTLKWKDEFYSFDRNPRLNKNIHVLASIDEKSYNIDENIWFKDVNIVMGDHPLVWCQEFDGGRSFHTALGHIPEMYNNEIFRKHIIGAIQWAAGKNK